MTTLHTFPPLFKKSNTGAILEWKIFVTNNVIETKYGQHGGAQQITKDTIRSGKNLGRSNATTPEEQALIEASAKWKKKQDREGYVPDLRQAEKGETNQEGGIAPMLAQPFKDAQKHLKFPCDAQRKFNGVRCIVMIEGGKASLWSRRQTPIVSLPHIVEAYEEFAKDSGINDLILDGEIYRHGWALQTISGFVRKGSAKEGFDELSHYVYDMPSDKGRWTQRRDNIRDLFRGPLSKFSSRVRMVGSVPILDSINSAKKLHDEYVAEGYEGVILRDFDGVYERGKRSYDLVKVKEFKEGEFEIVDVGQGRGRMEGKAVFVCKTAEGHKFECVAPGTLKQKAALFEKKEELIGKMLQAKFFEETLGGKPSHGVGLAVRDYE